MDGAGKRSGYTQCIPVDLYIHYGKNTLMQHCCKIFVIIFGASTAPLRLGEKKYSHKRGM